MQVVTADAVKALGTILGVWAHPDDEVFNVGGLLTAAVNNGQTVVCVTASRGEQGVQDEARWPAADLAGIREKELADAYKLLGIQHHYWLGYPDGGCAAADQNEAAGRIAEIIRQYNPDTILTFGPDGLTGHPDHQAVSAWAALAKSHAGSSAAIYHLVQTKAQHEAFAEADARLNIFFNTDKPPVKDAADCDVCLRLDTYLLDVKRRAFTAMPSQLESILAVLDSNFGAAAGVEALVRAEEA